MKELYELKERLIKELKRYGNEDFSASVLNTIDTLAHAAKNVCKIIESDDGYSGRYMAYDDGRGAYARRRDSMGRYSGNGYSRHGLVDKLRDLMDEAPDENTRMELKRLIEKM